MRKDNRYKLAVARAAANSVAVWPRLLLRAAVSLAILALFLWLLANRLTELDLADLHTGVTGVSMAQWAAALILTSISFWAVGRYDAVLHRHFATGLPERLTRRAGICAIAVSQTLGLGLITGAILRWRMLPGQSLWLATRLTGAVAVSFLAGWAVVTALVLLILPDAPFKPQAITVVIAATLLIVISLVAPPTRFRWPNGLTLLRLIGLAAVDTLAAAAAFHMLCPDTLSLPVATMLPAFMLALGAGLVTGTPGGVGPFELTLLALLPSEPAKPLVGAILAWRVCYYALPAILGAILAFIGPARINPRQSVATRPLLATAPRAETALLYQGEHHMLWHSTTAILLARTPHLLIALFDPIKGEPNSAFRALQTAARAESRLPALYKCNARIAAAARGAGFSSMKVAHEAWLDPRVYTLQVPSRSGLRRKLRRAEAAGITVSGPPDSGLQCWDDLTAIAANWAKAHGGERGFSTGRFVVDYVARQRIYIAWQNSTPIAFVTFHQTTREWTLDLMRHAAHLPDGTMHLLIQTAINDAQRMGLHRLSLAAVPKLSSSVGPMVRLFRRIYERPSGLVRFKTSFAPHWQPLYLVAQNRPALLLAAAEIIRAVHRPTPLPTAMARTIEHHHDDYEFASAGRAWHRLPE